MSRKTLVILAEGFEEIEAITVIDVLRRAEVDVVTAGLGKDTITGAHNITVKTDIIFENCDFLPDVIVLPGGIPGAENIASSVKVKDMIIKMNEENKLITAICAAPALVLTPTGILNGRAATCYPGYEPNFPSGVKSVKENVVQDGNIITSRGPGTAIPFSLKIAEALVGKPKADMLAEQLIVV